MNWKLNPDYPDPLKLVGLNIVEAGYLPKLVYGGNTFPSSTGKQEKKKKKKPKVRIGSSKTKRRRKSSVFL